MPTAATSADWTNRRRDCVAVSRSFVITTPLTVFVSVEQAVGKTDVIFRLPSWFFAQEPSRSKAHKAAARNWIFNTPSHFVLMAGSSSWELGCQRLWSSL